MRSILLLILLLSITAGSIPASAEEKKTKKQGPPPMLVETAQVTSGTSEPMVERVGTIRYARISRVATEVSGIVDQVYFNEGQRLKKGDRLIRLKNDLLKKTIDSTRAGLEQALIEKQRAEKELSRIQALFEKKSVSESVYDDIYFKVLGLEKHTETLQATLERQQLELKKTTVYAPFSGLVQKKMSEQGEWLSMGGQVALIADDSQIEVHIDVPQSQLPYLSQGRPATVTIGGNKFNAELTAIVPQGDISTRTFTIKLKIIDAKKLIEGMEASTPLPSGPQKASLLVPRDAVLNQFGQNILYTMADGVAKMIPIAIEGYQGLSVAVTGPGLESGLPVVVKGNERIRDGQAIRTN